MSQVDVIYTKNAFLHYPFFVGDHSYGVPVVRWWGEESRLFIGRYCSLGDGVEIFLGGNHRVDFVSTYPFSAIAAWPEAENIPGHPSSRGHVVIGSDVWCGSKSIIMSGVTIGHGAVIGAHAVVTRDVPPYGIVAGNPARLVRRRFSDDIVERLLAIRWWEWDDERVRQNVHHLMSEDISTFLQMAESSADGVASRPVER